MRKIIIQLSMALQTSMDYFSAMPISELLETVKEVTEIVSERKRVQVSGSYSGRR